MLLGSVSHQVFRESRKIAWSRINPKLKPLVKEVYLKRKGNLFGLCFWTWHKRRSSWIRPCTRSLGASGSSSGPPTKRPRTSNRHHNCHGLQKILRWEPQPHYGGRRVQVKQMLYEQNKFQTKRYFSHNHLRGQRKAPSANN